MSGRGRGRRSNTRRGSQATGQSGDRRRGSPAQSSTHRDVASSSSAGNLTAEFQQRLTLQSPSPSPAQPSSARGRPSQSAAPSRPSPSVALARPSPAPSHPSPAPSQPSPEPGPSQPSPEPGPSQPSPEPGPSQPPQAPPMSTRALGFAPRPNYGTVGAKCVVRANHFLVEIAEKELYHYDVSLLSVSITPEVTSKKVNRDVIKQLVNQYRQSHLGGRRPAYDGMKSLYTAGPLPFQSKDFTITLVERDDPTGPPRRERQFRVSIKFASQPNLNHLLEYLHSRHVDIPQDTIQVLDVVLRDFPSSEYTVVGRSFFSTALGPPGELGDGMEYWRGYYQSLRPVQMGLSLNIDVSARAFYEPILVSKFVSKYFNVRDLARPLSDQDRVKVKKALKGVRVGLTYRDHARRYRITGITPQPISHLTFEDDNGATVRVLDYFRQKYGVEIYYSFLPALQAGTDSKPVYLPMEYCEIVPGQRYTKKLNERQVTALLRATCQRPHERENSIKRMVREANFNSNELVNEFGIRVSFELSTLNARVLPPPMLKYNDTGKESRVSPRVGQWNMINKKMLHGAVVGSWTCISFSARLNLDRVHQFLGDLISMCSSKGMQFNPNPVVPVKRVHAGQIETALRDIHKVCAATEKSLQLLIIILPDVTGSYGKIKTICETELGIVSQCIQPMQAQKNSKQYHENVALKINVKTGGRNTVLCDAIDRRIPHVSDKPTIIFGADVTHPQPGEDSSPSIAAVVASMDWPLVATYRGLVSSQTHRDEIIHDLYKVEQDPQRGEVSRGMIRELLIAFRRTTGQKPWRIIFYRDGVSEGQFNQVLLHEMDAIRRVSFFLLPLNFSRFCLCTVVDTTICSPTEFDFYLNSHAGIQGTSRPTHYHVLYDENKFTADELQVLTNNLCYTYARCTRSVSIVPPAYYAHLAAFRARYYIEGDSTDTGSVPGGASGGARNTRERVVEVRSLPAVKENVKNFMFYC
ncbi:Argonaute, linker 1 domain [Dillenia turbinata]|uniref:Argonaute, linker 1 domain n=1 Tax=Dillenia turbinata TaxID=194707 RepID=A0AAN8VCB1_9MAGN